MMTGLKSDSKAEKASGMESGSETDVTSDLRWLHRRIEELGAALLGQQNAAREISGKGEEIIRFASETSGSILYALALESGRYRMIFGLREKLGFDPEEVDLNHDWWCDHIHPEDRPGVEAQFARAVETASGCRLRYRIRRKDGSYISVEDVMRASESASGLPKSMVGCIIDGPQPSSSEEPAFTRLGTKGEPWDVEQRQGYARKLESINRDLQNLTSIASHNLLDPLRKIRVFGEMMASKWGNSGEVPRYLARMQNAALRMQEVLDGLQAYSQIDNRDAPFSEVDLGRVVRKALAKLEKQIRDTGAEVEIDRLPSIEADDQQMMLLFQNLIDNGLKFHSVHRRPHIRIHAESDAGSRHKEAGRWRILVKDNGIGFEEEHLEKIFSPFQRLNGTDEYDGVGMGLAICKKIVDRHGGSITAKSAVGKGSAFMVTFPKRKR